MTTAIEAVEAMRGAERQAIYSEVERLSTETPCGTPGHDGACPAPSAHCAELCARSAARILAETATGPRADVLRGLADGEIGMGALL